MTRMGNPFGVGSSQGVMPYFRAAYEWNWNQQSAHVGALYMQSNVNPAVADFQTDGSFGPITIATTGSTPATSSWATGPTP